MSIDGVGKPPGGPPGIGGTSGIGKTGEGFHVEGPKGPASTEGSDALGRLQRGEISVDEYLDARVQQATDHLKDKLSAEQLDFVRDSLREQLSVDPMLAELVRRATGGAVAERG